MTKTKLDWTSLDPASFDGDILAAWEAIEAAKATFEAALTTALTEAGRVPAGHTVRVGYNYGKASFAFDKALRKSQNLADYLKANANR